MAKCRVRHTCGCEVEHNLYGKSDYREYKIRQLQEDKCYNCQKKDEIEEMLKIGKCEIKEVHYSDYCDDRDHGDKTMTAIPNTYNKSSKTIQVVVAIAITATTEEMVVNDVEQTILGKMGDADELNLTVDECKAIDAWVSKQIKTHKLDSRKVKRLVGSLLIRKYNMTKVNDTYRFKK